MVAVDVAVVVGQVLDQVSLLEVTVVVAVVVVTLILVMVLVTEEQVPVSSTVLVTVEGGPAGMDVVAVHWVTVLAG